MEHTNQLMYTKTGIGVPAYQAVELFDEKGIYTLSVDIWSLGCILYEMIHYNQLFTTEVKGRFSALSLIEKIRNHEHQPINESCSPEVKDLILKCVDQESTKRPTILDLLDKSIDLKMNLGQEAIERDEDAPEDSR